MLVTFDIISAFPMSFTQHRSYLAGCLVITFIIQPTV